MVPRMCVGNTSKRREKLGGMTTPTSASEVCTCKPGRSESKLVGARAVCCRRSRSLALVPCMNCQNSSHVCPNMDQF